MRTRVAGGWAALIGVQLVILGGGIALGCETSQLIGEPCGGDDECISGTVCRGAVCVAPIELGGDGGFTPEAGPDVAPDAEPDAEPDAAEDAPTEAETDAAEDVATDVAEDVADDAADAADDADDALDAGDAADA